MYALGGNHTFLYTYEHNIHQVSTKRSLAHFVWIVICIIYDHDGQIQNMVSTQYKPILNVENILNYSMGRDAKCLSTNQALNQSIPISSLQIFIVQ